MHDPPVAVDDVIAPVAVVLVAPVAVVPVETDVVFPLEPVAWVVVELVPDVVPPDPVPVFPLHAAAIAVTPTRTTPLGTAIRRLEGHANTTTVVAPAPTAFRSRGGGVAQPLTSARTSPRRAP